MREWTRGAAVLAVLVGACGASGDGAVDGGSPAADAIADGLADASGATEDAAAADGGASPDVGDADSAMPDVPDGGAEDAADAELDVEDARLDVSDVADAADVGGDAGHSVDSAAPDTADTTDTTDTTDTADTTDTTDTGGPDAGAFDCSAMPPLPRPFTFVAGAASAEDFVFDGAGTLLTILSPGGMIMKAPYGAPAVPDVPVPIQSRGVRLLADGSIVAVDTAKSEVVRIPTSGPDAYTKQVLASGLTNPNGIAVGMDGRVYVSGLAIVRVDPESKTHDVLHTYDGVFGGYDGITFSPDYQTLYFDEEYNDTGARIYRMTFDGDGEVDEVTPIATLPSQVKLDGMTADACGNLYVVEMSGIIWRVTPAGDVAVAADLTGAQIPGGAYLPAVNFGSGVGGWSRTRLYAMNWTGMTDGVFEVDIGVPGKAEPHLGP